MIWFSLFAFDVEEENVEMRRWRRKDRFDALNIDLSIQNKDKALRTHPTEYLPQETKNNKNHRD